MASEIITKIKDWVTDVVKDLTTLDVVTMTGTLKIIPASEGNTEFKKLLNGVKSLSTSELQALAITHIDLDKDALLFVKSSISEEEKPILEAHLEAVRQAQEMRDNAVKFAVQCVKEALLP